MKTDAAHSVSAERTLGMILALNSSARGHERTHTLSQILLSLYQQECRF